MNVITERLDGYIASICEHKDVMSATQIDTLRALVKEEKTNSTSFEKFHPSELDTLFTLVKSLQAKIVTDKGDLMAKTTTRDIASLTGAISALLRAFGSLQEKVDHAKEQSQLEYAVIEALKDLPKEARQAFFDRMDEASGFLQQVEDSHRYWAGIRLSD